MLTRWGRELDPDDPWPEHPRPQLVRPGWRSLNGRWEYAFTTTADRPTAYDGQIVVPFSPEAPLSGVGRQLQPDEWLWYRREVSFPEPPPGGRVLLHLGAVDQTCTVWVDGREAGGHVGGYLPFSLDVTDLLAPTSSHVLEVRVRDLSETGVHARGKQRLDRGEIWYTAQSGLWQSVWAEPVPASYVERLVVLTGADDTVELTVHVGGRTPGVEPAEVVIHAEGQEVARALVAPGRPSTVPLSELRRWSPDDPFLHELQVSLGADRVTSTAALRTVGVGRDDRGRSRLLLNGEPVQHVGVLDQGYWPDGLLTPPSDAAIVAELAAVRELGFNAVRKHVKIEPLRWYHHCDRLGLLVWQDMVNGGGRYRHLVTQLPARRPLRIPDRLHGLYRRDDAAGRAEFRAEVRATVELLRSVGAVVCWTVFNEGWGQFDANDLAGEVATLDPSRPVHATSGWVDQGGGDVRSQHRYLRPFAMPRRRRLSRRGWRRDERVVALTEYGGASLRVEGHDWSAEEYGYHHLDSPAEMTRWWTELHQPLVRAARDGLAATFFTQLTDVEDELNGLFTWDREVLKPDAEAVRRTTHALRHPRLPTPPTGRS